jgi:hypothetical protein
MTARASFLEIMFPGFTVIEQRSSQESEVSAALPSTANAIAENVKNDMSVRSWPTSVEFELRADPYFNASPILVLRSAPSHPQCRLPAPVHTVRAPSYDHRRFRLRATIAARARRKSRPA